MHGPQHRGQGRSSVGLNTGANEWFNDLTDVAPGGGYGGLDSAVGAGAAGLPGTTGSNLYYNTGAGVADTVTISWSGLLQDNHDLRGTTDHGVDTRHDQLFAGFLHSPATQQLGAGEITLSGSGMADAFGATPYDIYLYVDGENPSEVTEWVATLTGGATFYGEDTGDFINDISGGTYTQVTSLVNGVYTAGNYVLLEDVVGDFEVALAGVGDTDGVVLNGFEIVGVPEPNTLALLLLSSVTGLIRRRRKA